MTMGIYKRRELERGRRIFERFCRINKVSATTVTVRDSRQSFVNLRRDAARYLRDQELSYPVIGELLERHHASIMNMLSESMREIKAERSQTKYKRKCGLI